MDDPCIVEGCKDPIRPGHLSCERHAAFDTPARAASWGAGLAVGLALVLVAVAIAGLSFTSESRAAPGWIVILLFAARATFAGARRAMGSLGQAGSMLHKVGSALVLAFAAVSVLLVAGALFGQVGTALETRSMQRFRGLADADTVLGADRDPSPRDDAPSSTDP